MFTCHVISDLFYYETERFSEEDLTLPDVDLVIINGNIANGKKSMQYAQILCQKYPDICFVYNFGFTEAYIGNLLKDIDEMYNGIHNRKLMSSFWPKNLYYSQDEMIITLRTGFTISVFCAFGWPTIHSFRGQWKETYLYKNVIAEVTNDYKHKHYVKPLETSDVWHGYLWVWAYPEWVTKKSIEETDKARKWELTPNHYKVLVTHLNPIKDSRLNNISYSSYNIHLNDMLWIAADNYVDDALYQGAHLRANPGRGLTPRSRIINVEWVLTK